MPVRFPPPRIGHAATLFSVPFRRGTGRAGGRRPVSEKSPGKMERPCVRCAATGSSAEHVAGMTKGGNSESGNGPGACGGVRSRACSGFAVSLLRRNGVSALSVSEIGRGGRGPRRPVFRRGRPAMRRTLRPGRIRKDHPGDPSGIRIMGERKKHPIFGTGPSYAPEWPVFYRHSSIRSDGVTRAALRGRFGRMGRLYETVQKRGQKPLPVPSLLRRRRLLRAVCSKERV